MTAGPTPYVRALSWHRHQPIEPLIKPYPWKLIRFTIGFSLTCVAVGGWLVWWLS